MASDEVASLLTEQIAYYRALASEYDDHVLHVPGGDELARALDDFGPTGDILELACGTGAWTERLARDASSVTAVDSSPEMLEVARSRVRDRRVRFVHADIFEWNPDRRHDVVFFAFWLSHVPLSHFESFWAFVRRCLRPRGRVFFLDDGYRSPDELVEGAASPVIRRRLNDGTPFTIVKVVHAPRDLEERLRRLGWQIEVRATSGPAYWGAGSSR